MKKNLIALAVLAASGVASAQSSVTLYGIADVWFGSTKNDAAANPTRQTMVGSGGVDQSRVGLKGTEDLGGGLKANFVLEQAFNIDTGAQATAGQMFDRESYVGLSSGFGEVRLGKTRTPFDDINPLTVPGFNSALAPTVNVWRSTDSTSSLGGYNANPANTVYYASPSFSGFSGAASYSLGENKNTILGGNKAGHTGSFNVKYEGGPVYVGLAYQAEKAAGPAKSVKFTRVNGSYDLGVVKLLAGYGRVSDQVYVPAVAGAKTTEWEIGADVPVTSALTLSGGYAYSKDNDSLNTKRSGLGLAASYSLSKRTSVYGGVQSAKTKADGAANLKSDLYAVGIRHTF